MKVCTRNEFLVYKLYYAFSKSTELYSIKNEPQSLNICKLKNQPGDQEVPEWNAD